MRARQEDLREKVAAMGGSFDVNLTVSTTHLIAASLDTEKYRVVTTMKVWYHRSCDERTTAAVAPAPRLPLVDGLIGWLVG